MSEQRMEDANAKPLVIFDMNGIFTDREFVVFKGQLPDGVVPENATRLGKFLVWKRPGLEEFVSFVFEHYRVAVWSSVSKVNLDQLCNFVFGANVSRLEFIFDQNDCDHVHESIAPDIGEQRKDKSTKKPIFLKNLTKVWARYPQYNKANTIIVDDSDHKMINNPKTCHFNPGTWTRDKVDDNGLKVGGLLRDFLQSRVLIQRHMQTNEGWFGAMAKFLFGTSITIEEIRKRREALKRAIVTLEAGFYQGVLNEDGSIAYQVGSPILFDKITEAKDILKRIEDRLAQI